MNMTLLHDVLSAEMVVTDPSVLRGFSVDGVVPKAVLFPTSLSQAAEVMKLANTEKWGVIPWGGGTKMALGRVPTRVDLVLSTSGLNKIVDIEIANLTVTAQAGVRLRDLQDLLGGIENRCFFPAETDLKEQADSMCSSHDYKGAFLPLDPPFSRRATLGGIIASNSTGPKRLRYGLPRDLVLGIKYVAPTGEVIGMGGKTVKNVSGYDVSKIMIGSLGTLGILGDITCRLLPLPEQVAAVLVAFSTLAGAKGFSDRVLNSKLLPTSLEILDGPALALSACTDLTVPSGSWCVAIGLEGLDEAVNREIMDLKDMAKLEKASEVVALDRNRAATFWDNLAHCIPTDCDKTVVKFKGTFLISRYAQLMETWAAALDGVNTALTCSPGLGLAYAYIFGGSEIDIGKVAQLGEAFRTAAEQCGGSMVAESAPPALKEKLDPWGTPRGDFILMRRIKENLDPLGVLNPGRFLGGL